MAGHTAALGRPGTWQAGSLLSDTSVPPTLTQQRLLALTQQPVPPAHSSLSRCLPRPPGRYLKQGQVCILGQLLQVLHSRCGLDHTHQGRGAVERELAQQGLLIAEQQQGVVWAVRHSCRSPGHVSYIQVPCSRLHLEPTGTEPQTEEALGGTREKGSGVSRGP